MKRYKIVGLGILLFLFFFGTKLEVYAASKIGVCTYSPTKIVSAGLQGFQLKVTLYNDGTTQRTAKLGGKEIAQSQIATGNYVGDTNLLFLIDGNMFQQNGAYYQEYQNVKNCPTMQFIVVSSTNQFQLHVGSTIDTDGEESQVLTPNMTEVNQIAGTVVDTNEGCKYTSNVRIKLFGDYVTVRFFSRGNQKYYSIDGPSVSLTKGINEWANAKGVTFQIKQEDVDQFMSPTCNAHMYARCIEGNENNVMLQASPPDVSENCSVSITEADEDDGAKSDYEIENSKVDLEGLNGKQTCEGIFGTTDANGNFAKESFGWLIQTALNYIKIAGPILVILLSMVEFIKAIASSDEEAMKKAQSRLVIRLIAVVALFLLPFIIGEVLKLINGISNPTCGFK